MGGGGCGEWVMGLKLPMHAEASLEDDVYKNKVCFSFMCYFFWRLDTSPFKDANIEIILKKKKKTHHLAASVIKLINGRSFSLDNGLRCPQTQTEDAFNKKGCLRDRSAFTHLCV